MPEHHGMSEVARQLSERLAAHGHRVTLVATSHPDRKEKVINGVEIVEFDVSGSITGGIQGEYDRFIQFLCESHFDIMTTFSDENWTSDLTFPLLDQLSCKKVFIPTGFPSLYTNQHAKYYERMKDWMPKYDALIFLSNDYRDINFAREIGVDPKKILIIPNGAAEDEFLTPSPIDIRARLGISSDTLMVLHVGGYTGMKGHSEAVEIFSRARLKDAVLVLATNNYSKSQGSSKDFVRYIYYRMTKKPLWGFMQKYRFSEALACYRMMNPISQKQILLKNLSRAETIAAYQAADIFLFPSNLECSPIVLFECAASKTPFLASEVGNAREICAWTQGGKIMPTIKDAWGYSHVDVKAGAHMLEDLSQNPELMKQMGEAAYQAWQNQFTWEKIAQDYEDLYISLLSEAK
jgi:glycosyltransferase involved in cell wall biosynthesis